jgi:ankyrin repeat protein
VLIANNAKIDARNAEGRTPLMLAAAGGSTAVAEYLIANGAAIAATDVNGRIALHSAAEVRILNHYSTTNDAVSAATSLVVTITVKTVAAAFVTAVVTVPLH